MPDLEIHYNDDDWAALYVDGKLERIGDSYIAEERAMELCGVKMVQDSAFMRGQRMADGAAGTLEEIAEWKRHQNIDAANALREQAAALEREATAIERGER